MTIAVRERTGRSGLLRALGAGRDQVLALFLAEAVVLSLLAAWRAWRSVRQSPGCSARR